MSTNIQGHEALQHHYLGVMATWPDDNIGQMQSGSKKHSMATVFGPEGRPHHIAPISAVSLIIPSTVRVMLTMPSRHSMETHKLAHTTEFKKTEILCCLSGYFHFTLSPIFVGLAKLKQ